MDLRLSQGYHNKKQRDFKKFKVSKPGSTQSKEGGIVSLVHFLNPGKTVLYINIIIFSNVVSELQNFYHTTTQLYKIVNQTT